MPTIGRPETEVQRSFRKVKMAQDKREASRDSLEDKGKLLNSISGRQEKSIYTDSKSHNRLGKDEFVKLLTHQMQNQDPGNPMDQEKLTAQLAQFASLEQLSNLNTKFDKIAPKGDMESKLKMASLLGKKIVSNGKSLYFRGNGTMAKVYYDVPKPAEKFIVRILDKNNNIVFEKYQENIPQGSHTMQWDGETLDGQKAAEGEYQVQMTAWTEDGVIDQIKTSIQGNVESASLEEGEIVLRVDGKKVFLRDVTEFGDATPSRPAASTGPGIDLPKVPPKLQDTSVQEAISKFNSTQGIYD